MFDTNPNNTYGGYVYNPQNGQYQAKQSSTLSPEEYNRLVKQDNPFSLALTETELLRGFCNHRSIDGTKDTLVTDPDGTVHCEVCGYRFNPVGVDMTKDDVQEAVTLITDILQTIKLLFIDMPVPAQREFFQIIPLLDKVPQLFELAVRNFNKHENYNAWGYRGQNMGTMNLFNMLAGALNGGAPMGGNMGMNPGGYQYSAPMGGSPVGGYANPNPAFGAFGTPVAPMGAAPVGAQAPMMGGVPMPGYQPQTQGFQYGAMPQQPYQMDPNTAAQQQGAQAPTNQSATTDGKDVQATAQFKA